MVGFVSSIDASAPGIDWRSLAFYVALAVAGGLGMYFGIGGAFELLYYRRRDRALEWKCQPHRWPSPGARRKEIALGASNMTAGSIASGVFVYWVAHGGRTTLYFTLADHGVVFTLATAIAYVLATDFALYWAHRMFHVKPFFLAIHRVHHAWGAPTAFTSAAMHPVEWMTYQSIMVVPLFLWPVHVVPVVLTLIVTNYYALVDHSGVRLHSWIPGISPTRFHDDHHAHFHVNYGQTFLLWDRMFGTLRRQGRRYGVDVFGGKGAPTTSPSSPWGSTAASYWDYSDNAERETIADVRPDRPLAR